MKIITWNFQDMILGVYQGHPWCQGWPCSPYHWSGTLNAIQVHHLFTLHSCHTFNLYINTKLSRYLPWGPPRSWCQGLPSPSCLWSGICNVLQVIPSWPPIPDTVYVQVRSFLYNIFSLASLQSLTFVLLKPYVIKTNTLSQSID